MPSSTPNYSTFSGDDFSGEISWRVDEATTHRYRYFGGINNQKHDAAEESEQRAIASKSNRIFPCSDPEVFPDGRVKYEEALALAHRFIAEGYLYPHDELTYMMNLGLCCKRCGDWLAAETHYLVWHVGRPPISHTAHTWHTHFLCTQSASAFACKLSASDTCSECSSASLSF